jgi:hypothetical protein
MRHIAVIALSVACAFNLWAKDTAKPNSSPKTLDRVPAAELAAAAAGLVQETSAVGRDVATTNVVKAAISLRPAATPAIVASIARKTPEMAPIAAGAAAAEQPKQARMIARAAAAAAPSFAAQIVVAVARAVPGDLRGIAVAASQGAPGSDKAILEALALAFPDLKPSIEKASANTDGGVPLVESVLNQMASSSFTGSSTLDAGAPNSPVLGLPPGANNYATP